VGLLEDELAHERAALGDEPVFGCAEMAQQRRAPDQGRVGEGEAFQRRDLLLAGEEAAEVAAILDVDGAGFDGSETGQTPVGRSDGVDQVDFDVVDGLEADPVRVPEGPEGVLVLAFEYARKDGVMAVFIGVQGRLELASDGFGAARAGAIAAGSFLLLVGRYAWHRDHLHGPRVEPTDLKKDPLASQAAENKAKIRRARVSPGSPGAASDADSDSVADLGRARWPARA
jgi:hypothetical protein